MGIYKEEEKFFSECQKNRIGFVRDGVVSEEDYISTQQRIAFILKEVNDPDG